MKSPLIGLGKLLLESLAIDHTSLPVTSILEWLSSLGPRADRAGIRLYAVPVRRYRTRTDRVHCRSLRPSVRTADSILHSREPHSVREYSQAAAFRRPPFSDSDEKVRPAECPHE